MRTQEKSYIAARDVAPLRLGSDDVAAYQQLSQMGICLDSVDVNKMAASLSASGFGQDADLVAPITGASVSTPVQFLQAWLPGFVEVITAARKIDTLVGIATQGRWEDEEIVQGVMEHTGEASVYGDYTNVPMSSWNVNFERRSIVRFEEGLMVGRLEEARAASIRTNSAEGKREASARALEISRNRVGFFGYNNGANRTYGFLNDPALPAYVNVPVGAGGDTEWNTKTFLEVTADIRSFATALRVQSGDQIDPYNDAVVLVVSTDAVGAMAITSDYGVSVRDWVNKTFSNLRIESAPELDGANGGDSVAYMYAENSNDGSSDDGRTFVQVVPAKFQTLGVEQRSKSYVEDFTNATAGILTKRPYAVYRASGV